MIKIGDTIVKRINTGTASEPNYDAIRFIKGPDGKMVFASVNRTTLAWRDLHLMENKGMAYPYTFSTSTDMESVPCSAAQIEVTRIPSGTAGGGAAKSAGLTLRMYFNTLPSSISKFNVNGAEYGADYFYVHMTHDETDDGSYYNLFKVDVGRGSSVWSKETIDSTYKLVRAVGSLSIKVSLYIVSNPASDKYGKEYSMTCAVEFKDSTTNGYEVAWKYLYENATFTPEYFVVQKPVAAKLETCLYPRINLLVNGNSRFEYNLFLGGDLVGYRNIAQLNDLNGTVLDPDYTYDDGLPNIQLTT